MPLGQPPEQQLSAQASSRPSSSHSAARASSASKHPCCSNQALCSASQRRCCGANVAATDRSVARWEDSTRSGAKPDRRHRQWGNKARPRGSQEVFRVGRMTQLSPSTDGARPCPCFDDPVGDGAPAAAWLGMSSRPALEPQPERVLSGSQPLRSLGRRSTKTTPAVSNTVTASIAAMAVL